MPRSVSQSGAPVVAPQINNRPNLKGIFGKLSIHDVRNAAQSAIPCRLAYTPGVHERTANSHAISVAYDVMEAGRGGLSRSDAKALDKAMWQFSPQSPIRLGGKLQCYMTVLGAERASVALLLRESAGDERLSRCLSRCLDQLDRAIVKVAVRIGKCDGVPDGAYHGDSKSKKLFDEIEVAKGVMTRCVREVGGGEVMRGIAEAILPSAMRDSVAERLPDSFAKFDRADGAPDILNVLQVEEALSLQRVIGNMLEDGSPEALAEAVLHLLKSPEYVEQSQPGGKPDKPDKPDKPPRTPPPANPPQGLQPHACSGAASLHNNAPVNIDNKVDFDISKLFKLLDKPPLQWTDVRNLIDEMRRDAYSLGRSEERNLIQDELIAEQRELIAQQKQEIADLKERFLEKNRSLQAWANGSGLTRATPASTREQGTGTERHLRDATTSTKDLDQVKLDSSSLRSSGTPDLTRRENQLDRQNRQNRQNQQERRTDNEHSEQRQVNSRANGNGGPRNNNRPPEDEVDNTSRPINRASTSRQPDDEALNRLNQNNRNNQDNQNQRQRLGNTEQRLEGQRTEQNRHLQRGNDDNRLGNRRAPSAADGVYEEYKHYLHSLRIDVGRLEPDPFQPTSERLYKADRPWDPVNGFSPLRQILPRDVKNYVEERSANAGTPFVPFKTGPLLPPVHSSPGRVRELIQELGAARFVPSEIAGKEGTVGLKKSAPATLPAKSPLQEGMEAFFKKRDLALLERAQRQTVTRSATPLSSQGLIRPSAPTQPASAVVGDRTTFQSFLDSLPSSPIAVRGVLNRSDSRASIASDESDASETGFELGKRIYSASKQSRATLPPRAGHGPLNAPVAGLTPLARLARSIPSAPIVETAGRTHAASPASPGSANGQRQDVLRQNILDDARTPRGEKERSVSFSVPRDPLDSSDPNAVHERVRDEEPLQSDVTPGQQYKSFDEEWDSPWSSSTSSASSVAGDEQEEHVDFEFEPKRDNMVVQRSYYSAVSMDSGRDSPPVLSADESGEPKTPLRVADRVAPNPKANDLADQQAQLIKELGARLKAMKENAE